jgi:beta-lactamase class C
MRIIFSLIFLFAASIAHAGPIDTDEVDRRLEVLMDQPGMVGLSVAIVERGEIVFAKGYGETVKGSGDKVSADTVFRWASVSKSIAASTVMKLARDGHFGLTSPVRAHAPSLELPKSKYVVTVEDVLTHQTGIVRNAYDTRIEAGHPAKLVRTSLRGLPRICEPGQCHTYQNVAYDAASEMAETATGLPYKSVVNELFFEPLGMETASLTLAGLIRSKSWAKPHKKNGRTITAVKPTYYRVPGSAGVNSSVTDLARWMQAQMTENNETLPAAIQAATHTPRVSTPLEDRAMRRNFKSLKNSHYGLGWRVYDYEGRKVIGHRGAVQGYRALVLFDPELKTGVAAMWNTPHGKPVGLQLEIMDQVYGRPRRDWMRLGRR